MKKILFILIFIYLGVVSFSQPIPTTGFIAGLVIDNNNNPTSSASVSLLNASDSSVVKMAVAGLEGQYRFTDIPSGKYRILASSAEFLRAFSPAFDYSSSSLLTAPKIVIANVSPSLGEVIIVGRKNMVEQKIDRMVINVDASITNTGSSAFDVLQKSPGVQVDKDGNISLKGKQGVIVMIDGRPAYLSGPELANMLKGMEASQLEQIEIMTNPPAKYDAAGNPGVINIKTKKNKAPGLNGNFSIGATQGKYLRTNESLSLNYRNGKVSLFSNYSFSRNNNYNRLDLYRRFKNEQEGTVAIFEQSAYMRRQGVNNNLKAGMDYYPDKKTMLGIIVNSFYNPSKYRSDNISYLKDPSLKVDSIVQSINIIKEVWRNGSVNLNMRHYYDSTGKELTADIDRVKYRSSNRQELNNLSYTPVWIKKMEENLRGDLPTDINIYSARIDYTKPLSNEGKLELGWKSSYVLTDSRANYSFLEGIGWKPDYNKTNSFSYKENINAAYVNLNRKLSKKIGVQAGLRMENTNYSGLQYGNPTRADSGFHHSYYGLFPTIYLSYAAGKSNQFGFSVGRRIDRPQYESLNPFIFFIDKYTYQQGNPYMKPQYSNNFEVSHIFKGMLTTTVNYSITKDLFSEIFDQDGSYTTIVRQGNIGKRTHSGVSVSAQLKLASWLNSSLYANYNYSIFKGLLNGELLQVSGGNFTGNMNNQVSLKKGWSAEVSGWYRSKGIEGQVTIQPMGELFAGLAKQLLKAKGTVKLGISDLLYTSPASGNMSFKSTEIRFHNQRDSRMVNLTFSYRFGKPLNGINRQRNVQGLEEQSRVKGGN